MQMYQNINQELLVDPIPSSAKTHITRIVWQTVRRITNEIFGVKILTKKLTNKDQTSILLVCPTDEVCVRNESERCLERRKQEQENTNKQQSVEI